MDISYTSLAFLIVGLLTFIQGWRMQASANRQLDEALKAVERSTEILRQANEVATQNEPAFEEVKPDTTKRNFIGSQS